MFLRWFWGVNDFQIFFWVLRVGILLRVVFMQLGEMQLMWIWYLVYLVVRDLLSWMILVLEVLQQDCFCGQLMMELDIEVMRMMELGLLVVIMVWLIDWDMRKELVRLMLIRWWNMVGLQVLVGMLELVILVELIKMLGVLQRLMMFLMVVLMVCLLWILILKKEMGRLVFW